MLLSANELARGALDEVIAGLGATIGALGQKVSANGERLRRIVLSSLGSHSREGKVFERAYRTTLSSS
jgi:hypothetical protein